MSINQVFLGITIIGLLAAAGGMWFGARFPTFKLGRIVLWSGVAIVMLVVVLSLYLFLTLGSGSKLFNSPSATKPPSSFT